ncbi:GH1 family beta-glucosidase [Nocardioides sp. Kera G14]|uniref:GH1 family beta-glucosidase n=1 Tax=Nocardioides sp. Kera G14 TaxID=2884264 RepID=UPI001D118702|nr:GH1 family beta-glucosidase [Nocardioides sp. Kera G14]UDY24621.1 beta-glucosidase [Nocardioides sp. Kera G14]
MTRFLPDGDRLHFGAATASYQIEGATTIRGRGPSIWDTFAAKPGAVKDGKDGKDAPDSYFRYTEDADLLRDLGAEYYRFSVAWPRIIPAGTGDVEPRGLDYYDRVVDALLERGVTPTGTFYHWDLPQALEDKGGWLNRDTAYAFADYAMVVHDRLGDRVKVWATHNEPWCATYLGYAAGVHAPGLKLGGEAHRVAHHLNLGHGVAAQRLHAAGCEDVGIVHNLAPIWPEEDCSPEAADGIDAIRNRVWLDPLIDGAYDDGLLRVAPELADPELVQEGDLELIKGSADWLGINYYTPVRPGPTAPPAPGQAVHPETEGYPGAEPVTFVVRDPRTDIGWEVEPRGLEELLIETHKRTGLPLMVTENGAAYDDHDRIERDGVSIVDDQDRIAYLDAHIEATRRAREAGADVRAYICWTLLDNFEWAEGYTKYFGIVGIDPLTKDRIPKASYYWLQSQLKDSAS